MNFYSLQCSTQKNRTGHTTKEQIDDKIKHLVVETIFAPCCFLNIIYSNIIQSLNLECSRYSPNENKNTLTVRAANNPPKSRSCHRDRAPIDPTSGAKTLWDEIPFFISEKSVLVWKEVWFISVVPYWRWFHCIRGLFHFIWGLSSFGNQG